MASIWDGYTRAETLSPEAAAVRKSLADAAKRYDWDVVFAILSAEPKLVNTTRPGGSSLYSPLHRRRLGVCWRWGRGGPSATPVGNAPSMLPSDAGTVLCFLCWLPSLSTQSLSMSFSRFSATSTRSFEAGLPNP